MTTADYLHATAEQLRDLADDSFKGLHTGLCGERMLYWAEDCSCLGPATSVALATWIDACALVAEVAPTRVKANALAVCRAYNPEGEDS